ncbi:AAA family ATPase [Bdellovibrionota bacterium FG-1]
MPHSRTRFAISELKRKLQFSPIVTIQGPRQCGKSFLAREVLPAELGADYRYVTLDLRQTREMAQNTPSLFLSEYAKSKHLAIDEAQKAPDLFDEIKARVDVHKNRGQFLLLGSTEFSREVMIRESLTGRLSRQRLFPLTLAEAHELPPSLSSKTTLVLHKKPRIRREQFIESLRGGGLPGIFALRSEAERTQKLQEWIEVTAFRDLLQFKGAVRPDPELALSILEGIATLEHPDVTSIRDFVKKDLRRVKTHLNLLEQLFAIQKIRPHQQSTGKDLYLLCDSGLASRLGASVERLLYTQLVLEVSAQLSYSGQSLLDTKLSYYRAAKGALVHLLIEDKNRLKAVLILGEEKFDRRSLRAFSGVIKKLKPTELLCLYGGHETIQVDQVELYPWEALA